jgi:hypothetical protein
MTAGVQRRGPPHLCDYVYPTDCFVFFVFVRLWLSEHEDAAEEKPG